MTSTAPAAPPPPPPPVPSFGKQPVKKFEKSNGLHDRDALLADIRNGPRLRSVSKPKEKKLFVSVNFLHKLTPSFTQVCCLTLKLKNIFM